MTHTPSTEKPPVVVADFAALDAEWAAYIEQGAFESVWLLRREADGALVGPGSVEGVSVAVSHFHRQKGLTPANSDERTAAARWTSGRAGAKTAAQNRDPEASVAPMLRTDALTLLAAPPATLRPVHTAALLLLSKVSLTASSSEHITAANGADAGVVIPQSEL